MRAGILLLLLFLPFVSLEMQAAKCECGTHQTGITTYNTVDDFCCSSVTTGVGFHYTYVLIEGVWQVDTTTQLTGSQAQANCCPPT